MARSVSMKENRPFFMSFRNSKDIYVLFITKCTFYFKVLKKAVKGFVRKQTVWRKGRMFIY